MKRYSPRLFPPQDDGYGALALRPVLISGMATPVEGGDGGINAGIINDSPMGLLAAVDPYQRMSEGDHLEIYWDQTLVAEYDIAVKDINKRVFFYLSTTPVKPEWAEKVFYRLIRKGATTPEDSVALRLRVKLDLPGGVDKDPHLPGHSELASPRLPQDVIDNGIDADWAAKGIPVQIAAYPGRAAHDTLHMKWGNTDLTHKVTPGEASGSDPIAMIVDQATILAGGDATDLLVHYEVFDEVWNFSTDWSLRTSVRVEAGAHRLDAPILRETVNGIIDLERLGGRDEVVQIEVRGTPFERGDTVTMTWAGTTVTGSPLTHTEAITLTNIPVVLEPRVPNADIRAIREGRAEASYVLTKANGDPPQSSKRALARITGRIPLPMPMVVQTVGDLLDPELERAHVQIPVYADMESGDSIDMIWLGTLQNGTPYLHETQHSVSAGEVGNVIHIPVTAEHIAPLSSGKLDISYRVSNDAPGAFDVRASDHLYLVVARPAFELPAPSVDEAQDNQLDPDRVPEHATLRVSYPGTATGDVLTWYWHGASLEGSARDWVPITSPSAGQPLTFHILRSVIEPTIDSTVKVSYSLKLASTGKYQYSHVLELAIGKLPTQTDTHGT
ncbi:hypothetical protein K5D33_02565 [Pseudomonas cichorii]|nr:hypothetical protein [Pseudomonas cichorii]MBX8533593.1 hypothetical protein [Pseudomonas cichorii]MBX8538573.1 hypothetical protein [Pseudomonas cichorii]MBX8559042.1 hypothetical protein [Pseudomonas cichorii]MBX8568204.1 hypothetical protein [Pseudomonas cichorii]MBX8578468.1 hypothetical protein [Pseudomonas cichorii]